MCKKLLFIFCLFFLLRPLSATQSFHIDWVKLDDNLNMLEWNLNDMKITIESLQMDLQEHQKYSANLQLQLETYENKYQRLEKTIFRCRTLLIVITVVAIGEGIVIYKCIGD